jgi:hypothetical protein
MCCQDEGNWHTSITQNDRLERSTRSPDTFYRKEINVIIFLIIIGVITLYSLHRLLKYFITKNIRKDADKRTKQGSSGRILL